MALPKAVNYLIVLYIVGSILYTSYYLLGFKSPAKNNAKTMNSVASLQDRYLSKQLVDWVNPNGKTIYYKLYFIPLIFFIYI
jgi:glycosyltransferase-like protein LARGE